MTQPISCVSHLSGTSQGRAPRRRDGSRGGDAEKGTNAVSGRGSHSTVHAVVHRKNSAPTRGRRSPSAAASPSRSGSRSRAWGSSSSCVSSSSPSVMTRSGCGGSLRGAERLAHLRRGLMIMENDEGQQAAAWLRLINTECPLRSRRAVVTYSSNFFRNMYTFSLCSTRRSYSHTYIQSFSFCLLTSLNFVRELS